MFDFMTLKIVICLSKDVVKNQWREQTDFS